jgi:hypothetical protein
MIFSAIAGDNRLARLAQHILIGAALGYLSLLVWQQTLRPRLVAPLLNAASDVWLWAPLTLGLLLWIAGLERIVHQGAAPRQAKQWQRALRAAGIAPVALMLGIGGGAGIMGALQGTLFPQFWRAAAMGFDQSASILRLLSGVLTLLITTGVLLHLYVNPVRHALPQQGMVRQVMLGWMWLGKRALWLAAGLIFARLLAARLSLLIARLEFLVSSLYATELWQWLEALWSR